MAPKAEGLAGVLLLGRWEDKGRHRGEAGRCVGGTPCVVGHKSRLQRLHRCVRVRLCVCE